MSQRYTAPEQQHKEPIISLAAIIAAGLASATAAVISPYFEFGTNGAIIGAAFTSVVITTSSAIYKAFLERGRRWRSILLVGLLAGLITCFLAIGGVSAAEFAVGKEPSIMGGPPILDFEINPRPSPGGPNPPPCDRNAIDDDGNGKVDEPGDCKIDPRPDDSDDDGIPEPPDQCPNQAGPPPTGCPTPKKQ